MPALIHNTQIYPDSIHTHTLHKLNTGSGPTMVPAAATAATAGESLTNASSGDAAATATKCCPNTACPTGAGAGAGTGAAQQQPTQQQVGPGLLATEVTIDWVDVRARLTMPE
jgi:hypothetical protein